MQTRDHQTYGDWDEPPKESRLNTGLLLRTMLGVAIVVGAGYGLRQFFMGQNCAVLEQRAQKAVEAGDPVRGQQLYRQYLNLARVSRMLTPEAQADVLERIADLEEQSAKDSRQVRSLVATEEELLRLSPERRAIRYRLIERLRLTGRYSDAVAHLETLKQKASPDELPDLDNLLAECHFRLRNFAEAQINWGRSLEIRPAQTEAYVGLARLWTQTDLADLPASLAERATPWKDLLERLTDSDGQPRLGQMHAAVALLNLMRTEAKAPEAQLAMVRLILELPPAQQVLSRTDSGAEEEARLILRDADGNGNGRLDGAELLSHRLRQVEFADLELDGVILREELKARLLLTEQEARLACASAVLNSLPPDPDQQELVLPVKLDLLHARSQTELGRKPALAAALREETRKLVAQGLEIPSLRPRCEVILAQLDLEAAAGTKPADRASLLAASEQHARQGLADLPSPGPLLRYSATAAELFTLRQQARLTLADVLLQRAELEPATQQQPLLKEALALTEELEQSGVIALLTDGLRLHAAILSGPNQKIMELAGRVRDAGFSQAGLRRRIAGLLARAYRQIGHHEQVVEVFAEYVKADPNSGSAVLGLAEALIAAGRAPEAIAPLRDAAHVPGAALRLSQLLQRQQAVLVPQERKWEDLDRAEQAAREVSGDTAEFAAIEINNRRLKLWTDAVRRSAGNGAVGLSDTELEDLEQRYQAALEKFPENAEVWQSWIQTTAERIDLPQEQHQDLIQQRLQAARAAVGNTPGLLLAEASAMLPSDPSLQADFLREIESRAATFSPQDQRLVLESLAVWWLRQKQFAEAQSIWVRICELAPKDPAAHLQLLETLLALKWETPDSEVPDDLWNAGLQAIATIEGTEDSTVAYLRAWRLLLEARTSTNANEKLRAARAEIVKVEKLRPKWFVITRLNGLILSLGPDKTAAVQAFKQAYAQGDRSQLVISALIDDLKENNAKGELAHLQQQLEAEDRSKLSGALGRSLSRWAAENDDFPEAIRVAQQVANSSGKPADRLEEFELRFKINLLSDQDLLAFALENGSQLPGAWELLLRLRVRNRGAPSQIDEVVSFASKSLPESPPELKPRSLARLQEYIGSAILERQPIAWRLAAEYYDRAIAAAPDNHGLRLSAIRLALRRRHADSVAVALLQPLRANVAALPQSIQRDVHLLSAQLELRGGLPGGVRTARQSLLNAVATGDHSLTTLQVLLATLEKDLTPADQTSIATTLLAVPEIPLEQADVNVVMAQLLAVAGRWPESESRFQLLLSHYPKSAPVVRAYLDQLTVRCRDDVKLRPTAEDLCQRLVTIAPEDWETARSQALLFDATGKTTSAISRLVDTASQRMQRPPAAIVQEWLRQSDWQKSADQLFDLQFVLPALRPAWQEVVDKMLANDFLGAVERLQKSDLAALVVEWNLRPVAEAALLLERMQAYREAEALLRQLDSISASQNRKLELAAYLTRRKDPVASLAVLESGWDELDPLVAATSALAIAESGPLSTDALKRLLERVTKAAGNEVNPIRQARLYLILGNLTQSLQDWDGALEAYLHVIDLDPTHAVGQNNTAYMLAKLGRDLPKARAAITEALRLEVASRPLAARDGTENHDMIDTQATVSIEEGNPLRAIEELKRAKELSRNGKLQARLAEALWQAGNKQQALEAWAEALRNGWTAQHSHPLDRPRHSVIAKAEAARSANPAPKP